MQSPRESLLCQYRYDPLDRLIANALSNKPEHQRFYCQSRLTTEIQGAMRFFILQHDGRLLAQQQDNANTRDTTLLASDQQRSILQALKASHPLQPIAYSPYGHRSVLSGLLSLLGFNGERPEPATGHYLLGNGYRAFNPVLMRFNSPDSLSPFEQGGRNSYTYCLGDPVNQTDPTGHLSVRALINFFESRNVAHANRTNIPTTRMTANVTRSPSQVIESVVSSRTVNTQTIGPPTHVGPPAYSAIDPFPSPPPAPGIVNAPTRPPAYSFNDPFPAGGLITPERPPNYFELNSTQNLTDGRVNQVPTLENLVRVNIPRVRISSSRPSPALQGDFIAPSVRSPSTAISLQVDTIRDNR